MEEVLGIILLVVTIIVSLLVVGLMFCGLLWFVDWRQERKFKKYQKEGLSKEDWKDGQREEYKHWLGY